ncbi:MAG: serine/threonine protein kinase, partial [Deltaproteobacteria bacterium]
MAPSHSSPGCIGRYRLVRRLGYSGTAEAFEARAEGAAGIVKRVCVERIHPALAADPTFVHHFTAEAQAAMALSHGNLAQVFDFGQAGGVLYLAMELVDGPSLSEVHLALRRLGLALPPAYAAHILVAVCKGLHYIHTLTDAAGRPRGWTHRDVRPQTIRLSYEGQVKLVDFGIAAAAARCDAGDGAVLSERRAYLAPECAAGVAANARTDVFAAGAVLYELLAGTLPPATGRLEPDGSAFGGAWPPLNEIAPWVDPKLAEIVDRAVAPLPAARWPGALDLQQALATWCAEQGAWTTDEELGALLRWLFAARLQEAGRTTEVAGAPPARLLEWKAAFHAASRRHTGRRPRLRRALPLVGVILAAVAAAASLLVWSVRRPVADRTVRVLSQPAGAAVFVDGRDTHATTPALLPG